MPSRMLQTCFKMHLQHSKARTRECSTVAVWPQDSKTNGGEKKALFKADSQVKEPFMSIALSIPTAALNAVFSITWPLVIRRVLVSERSSIRVFLNAAGVTSDTNDSK